MFENQTPTPGRSIMIFTKDGKVIQATSRLSGSEIVFEKDGKVINQNDIQCWNVMSESAPPRKKCRSCERRWN